MRYFHPVLIASVVSLSPPAQSQPVADFSGWEVLDKGGRTMPYLGRPSLYLERGIALMPNSTFADGAIDFDVAIHGQSGFAGVVFRSQTPEDYELVYLRTHRSRQWDALQYTPIIRNEEAWQLYAGAGYNGVAELPANRWVHIRVEVEGYSARVFVDRATTPQLVVQDLKRPWAAGRVGLWGRSGAANFSNVIVTPATGAAPSRPPATAGAGVVSRWALSQSFATDSISTDRLPDGLSWIDVPAESSGIVNIAQHRARVPAGARGANDSGRDTVFAKAVLRTSRAQRVRVGFGYSDDVTVFLDGQPIFAGANGYLLRDGSSLGTLTLGPDALFIDLAAGRHELIFGVTEAFGGWGVVARIEGGADVTVERP